MKVNRVAKRMGAKEYLRNVTESINREQNAPRDMLITICQLEQELGETQRVSDPEYTELASRKQKPTNDLKEQTMAKVSIDVQDVTLWGGVVVGSAIISVEVPDDAFATIATMYERCLPLILSHTTHTTHEHVCKCEASNDDKRPGTFDRRKIRERSNA